MGDENSEMMNLDLNLGPNSSPDTDLGSAPLINESVNLEDWIDRESTHVANPNESTHSENQKLAENEEKEKGNSFFDCNICLDVSSQPVLTCCGHLFCWPCLHQWLNIHSDTKECPVCKGEVTITNLTPIYGRGSCKNPHENDEKPSFKIPNRPQARRVESWRQMIQRNAFTIPMDEMIRRLGSSFSFSRELIENQTRNTENSLLNQILTSRGMRQEQENITHRLIESYMRYTSDDRDSESLNLDTAVEIDSNVVSRVSDVDSGDSRAPRRRRLN